MEIKCRIRLKNLGQESSIRHQFIGGARIKIQSILSQATSFDLILIGQEDGAILQERRGVCCINPLLPTNLKMNLLQPFQGEMWAVCQSMPLIAVWTSQTIVCGVDVLLDLFLRTMCRMRLVGDHIILGVILFKLDFVLFLRFSLRDFKDDELAACSSCSEA